MSEEVTFGIKIIAINVLRFSQFDLIEDFDKNKYPLVSFKTNLSFRVLEEENRIDTIMKIEIDIIETQERFADLLIEMGFEISPLESVINKSGDNKYNINSHLVVNLASISMSTVRGILYEKFKGSLIQKEIYPLIDAMSLKNNLSNKTSNQ